MIMILNPDAQSSLLSYAQGKLCDSPAGFVKRLFFQYMFL